MHSRDVTEISLAARTESEEGLLLLSLSFLLFSYSYSYSYLILIFIVLTNEAKRSPSGCLSRVVVSRIRIPCAIL